MLKDNSKRLLNNYKELKRALPATMFLHTWNDFEIDPS